MPENTYGATTTSPRSMMTSPARCPNCTTTLKNHRLPGHYGATVELDTCHDCHVLWLDHTESQQLSADGVVELFQMVHAAGQANTAKLGEGLACVRCKKTLNKTQDRVASTRFNYLSCEAGHGRLITFYQFLAEKQFVRELTPAERNKLAAEVRQVRCSGCGAGVDLAVHNACEYCRAPIAVFDRNAAQRAIDHYLKQRNRQLPASPGTVTLPTSGPLIDPWTYTAADLALDAVWAMARFASRSPSAIPASAVITSEMLPSIDDVFSDGLSSVGDNATTLLASGAVSHLDASDALIDSAALAQSGDGLLDLVGDGVGSLIESIFS